MSGTIREWQFGPYIGPTAGFVQLVQNVTTAPTEGPWLPCRLFKQMGFTAEGTLTGLTATIWFSNALNCPLNGYTVTIGGTITSGDVVSLTVASSVAGNVTVSHTVASGDTVGTIAAALATALNANAALTAAGYQAAQTGALIALTYPSLRPGAAWFGAGLLSGEPSTAPPVNYTLVTGAVSGAGTETVTTGIVSTTGANVLSLSSSSNHAVLATPARWVKGKVTALTSGPIEIDLAGVA